jgi:hypothetical protein
MFICLHENILNFPPGGMSLYLLLKWPNGVLQLQLALFLEQIII